MTCFIAVFNNISLISLRPMHLSMLSSRSFNQYSAQYSFQATGCFPTSSKQWAMREKWILSQWLSSISEENIGRTEDRTSNLACTSPSPICYRLLYGAPLPVCYRLLYGAPLPNDRNLDRPNTKAYLPCPKQALVFTCLQHKSFENTEGKG